MRVVTFYSFKGGVGRSNLLFNVAYLLAKRHGQRVVMADWDIHAPGLTCLYDLQDPEGHLVTPGVLDILSDLAGESGAAEVIDPGELLHRTRVGKRMTDEGDIWFLSAGAFSPRSSAQYEEKIRDLRPELPRLATMGKDLLTWLEERVIARFRREDGREPDFLFLDARTGLTEVGDLLMSRLPNHRVVLVFGLNEQNLKGLEHVFGQLVAKTGVANAASRIVLVASPIPPGEEELKRRRMQAATAMLEGVLTEAARRASAQGQPMVHPKLPPFHTVPFHPLVALTEEPIAERFPESDIAVAFAAIANRLRGSAVEVEKVQSSIGLSVRETAPSKPSEPARLVEPEAEHPMARRLAWDVVRPGTKPKEILRTEVGAEAPAILEGLANSISLSAEERAQIIDDYSTSSATRREELVRIFGEEHRRFLGLPEIHWSQLASFCGVSWAEWSVLSARRLDVESRTAAARMWAAWPLSWRSRTSVYAIDAAVKALASSGASWKEAGRDALHLLVEASPKDAQALGFAGAILIQTYDDHETGERLLDRAMAQTTDAETWGALGERLFEAARALAKRGPALLARAISCFERWVEASPMDAYARRRLADAQGELAARTWADAPDRAERLFTESEGQYKAALAIKPDMHEAENNWGSLLGDRAKLVEDRDAGRAGELYAAAEAHYRRAIELKPDMPEAEHNWGSVLKARAELVKGRDPTRAGELYAAAEAHYRRAIELKPDMPEAENNWGNVLVARAEFVKDRDPGRADELFAAAEVHYRRAIELKPDDHKAEYNWGSVLTRRAKLVKDRDAARADELFAAAEAHYRRAIELKPDDPNIEDPLIAALLWRSHILIAQERRAEASAMVEEALQRSRAVVERTGRPNYNLACALAQHGDVEQALETLEALEQRGELVELEWLLSDPDLAPLREYSGFGSLVERLRQATQKRVPAEPSTA